jgi:hypothetical protein
MAKLTDPQPANAVRDREVEMSSMVAIVRLKSPLWASLLVNLAAH